MSSDLRLIQSWRVTLSSVSGSHEKASKTLVCRMSLEKTGWENRKRRADSAPLKRDLTADRSVRDLNNLDFQAALVLVCQFNRVDGVVDPEQLALVFDARREGIAMALHRITVPGIAQFER